MKHKIADDVNVNLNVDIDTQNLATLVDKIVEGAVTIIVVATTAHIFRKWMVG